MATLEQANDDLSAEFCLKTIAAILDMPNYEDYASLSSRLTAILAKLSRDRNTDSLVLHKAAGMVAAAATAFEESNDSAGLSACVNQLEELLSSHVEV